MEDSDLDKMTPLKRDSLSTKRRESRESIVQSESVHLPWSDRTRRFCLSIMKPGMGRVGLGRVEKNVNLKRICSLERGPLYETLFFTRSSIQNARRLFPPHAWTQADHPLPRFDWWLGINRPVPQVSIFSKLPSKFRRSCRVFHTRLGTLGIFSLPRVHLKSSIGNAHQRNLGYCHGSSDFNRVQCKVCDWVTAT